MRARPSFWSVMSLMLAVTVSACEKPISAPARAQHEILASGYQLVSADLGSNTASATIDAAGGSLVVNGHQLMVLPNSLLEPTTFTMTSVAGSIQVELHAVSVSTGLPVAIFPSPLRLSLSYGSAKVSNPNRLAVAWILNGQVITVQPSDVDKSNRLVSTWLYHFSDYALVQN